MRPVPSFRADFGRPQSSHRGLTDHGSAIYRVNTPTTAASSKLSQQQAMLLESRGAGGHSAPWNTRHENLLGRISTGRSTSLEEYEPTFLILRNKTEGSTAEWRKNFFLCICHGRDKWMETFLCFRWQVICFWHFFDVEVWRKVALLEITFIFCYFFHMILTRARPGGGYPPLRFFADSEKTAAGSAAKFAIAVQPTILAHFQKWWPNDPKGHASRSH